MALSEKEFSSALAQFQPYIISQVIRLGGGDDADDLVQDVNLQVLRLRHGFDPDRGSFSTWLYWQIRSCLQQRRARQRKRRSINLSMEYREDGEPVTEATVVDNPLARIELRETVRAVYDLKPREAHAVLQRAVGASFAEIGREFDATPQYAQQLHALGVKNLRRRLNRLPFVAVMQ